MGIVVVVGEHQRPDARHVHRVCHQVARQLFTKPNLICSNSDPDSRVFWIRNPDPDPRA